MTDQRIPLARLEGGEVVGVPRQDMVERVKEAIARCYAPAIDHKAPYAKVMLDMAARAAIAAILQSSNGDYDAGAVLLSEMEKAVKPPPPDEGSRD
jgi:hypothetical protein